MSSVVLSSGVAVPLLSQADLASAGAAPTWLWHGFVARGAVTLLTSQWKSGKTTLLSVLLSKMKSGGLLADLAVSPGRALVLTEEGPEHWRRRADLLDLGAQVHWMCRPFPLRPTAAEWHELLGRVAEMRGDGLDLVVIDALAAFLPGGEENHAGLLLNALQPLRQLTDRGLAVLVLHHPRKGPSLAGQAARGSGALGGYVDVLIEMHWYLPDNAADRRRRLRAWSRFPETPAEKVIELNAAGSDYLGRGDFQEAEQHGLAPILFGILEAAAEKLTRKEVYAAWPATAAVDERTVGRLLERALAAGLVERTGTGHRNRPFCYGLPGRQRTAAGVEELPELEPLDYGWGDLDPQRLLDAAEVILNRSRR